MNFRFTVVTFIALGFILTPNISSALTNDEIAKRIASLLAQVQTLQQQLQVVENSGPIGPVSGTYTGAITNSDTLNNSTHNCVNIARNLKRGDENDDVRKLQVFLAQDTTVYPTGLVSGYYGALTEDAVQRWQVKYGVVSTGSAATTGYGAVGPKTRQAMNVKCGVNTSVNRAIARELVVTPEVGPLPLQVTATFSLNGSSCSSYYLDWGDGTQPLLFDAGNSNACTKDIAHKQVIHTYTRPGVHHITLRAGHGSLSQAVSAGQTLVSVGATTPTGLSLNPTSGAVPFTTSITFPVSGSTCTSYEARWGDGTIDKFEPKSFNNCVKDSGTQSLTHTYKTEGTYKVEFKSGNARILQLPVSGSWNVKVDSTISADTTLRINPTTGTAPLVTNVELFGYGESCTSYFIDWGDGSQAEWYDRDTVDCDDFPYKRIFNHAYTAAGTYTIRTKVSDNAALVNTPFNNHTVVVGAPRVQSTLCTYPNTPVCGEIPFSCLPGYSCDQLYKTFTNRCEMELLGADFIGEGTCRF